MNGNFIQNGNPFYIQAQPGSGRANLIVLLPQGLNYQVASKDFPPNMPSDVTWIYNFGLQQGGNSARGRVPQQYELILDDVPGVWYYFDGSARQTFSQTRRGPALPGKISALLDLGDPPIGTGN